MQFSVAGIPVPQGSKKAFRHPHLNRIMLVDDNKRLKPWRNVVVAEAMIANRKAPPIDGPVIVTLDFYLPRPKSAPKRLLYPIRRPDVDKMARAVLDALTLAAVYHDDAQVCALTVRKFYGRPRTDIDVGVISDLPTESGLHGSDSNPPY